MFENKEIKVSHGLDLNKPGALEKLFAYNRNIYGDAVMQADDTIVTDSTEITTDAVKAVDDAGKVEGEATDQVKDWQAEAEKWKSLSRKNEETAKSNHTKLSELEKQLETFSESAKKLAEIEEKNILLLKQLIVKEKGLPDSALDRLRGATEEELRADGDDLAQLIGNTIPVKKNVQPVQKIGSDTNKETSVVFSSYEEHLKANRK